MDRQLMAPRDSLAFVYILPALRQSPELVDTSRIFLSGSTLGGNVALFTAVRNPSLAGVALYSPFHRRDTAWTEYLQMYYREYALMPQLAQYQKAPEPVPTDLPQLLGSTDEMPWLLQWSPESIFLRNERHETFLKQAQQANSRLRVQSFEGPASFD